LFPGFKRLRRSGEGALWVLHVCAAVVDVAVGKRTGSCTARGGGIKASSLPVPLLRSLTGQVSVKKKKKRRRRRLFFQLTHV